MIGSSYRSWSSRVVVFALGLLVGTVVLGLLCALLRPLLVGVMGVSIFALIVVGWARWRLFRFRGW